MTIGLFIPCYIDQFYPSVGIATYQLLKKLGCDVIFPIDQGCCGQPLANSGFEKDTARIYTNFIKTFKAFDFIVAPSPSCVYHVQKHYDIIPQTEEVVKVRKNILDLSQFLIDVMHLSQLDVSFPFKVGIHQGCHGLRGLRLASSSELVDPPYSKWESLLTMVQDIELVELSRPDECCGFGGTFAVVEEAVSVQMGKDRIQDHLTSGVEVITSGDMSCLMHLDGLIRKNNYPIKVKHLAEILNGL